MRITVSIPDDLAERINFFATEHALNTSDAIRFLVVEGLKREGDKHD